MKISELAYHTGVSIRSLRYYETKHLLSPIRQENGYRLYDQAAIERVRNIQFYLHLGLTAHQIFQIICCNRPDCALPAFDESDHAFCQQEIDLYKDKLTQIEEQITALEMAKAQLRQRLAFSMRQKNAAEALFVEV